MFFFRFFTNVKITTQPWASGALRDAYPTLAVRGGKVACFGEEHDDQPFRSAPDSPALPRYYLACLIGGLSFGCLFLALLFFVHLAGTLHYLRPPWNGQDLHRDRVYSSAREAQAGLQDSGESATGLLQLTHGRLHRNKKSTNEAGAGCYVP